MPVCNKVTNLKYYCIVYLTSIYCTSYECRAGGAGRSCFLMKSDCTTKQIITTMTIIDKLTNESHFIQSVRTGAVGYQVGTRPGYHPIPRSSRIPDSHLSSYRTGFANYDHVQCWINSPPSGRGYAGGYNNYYYCYTNKCRYVVRTLRRVLTTHYSYGRTHLLATCLLLVPR